MRLIDDEYSYRAHRERHRLAQAYRDFRAHMEAVADARPEWYVWVTEGQPVLTAEQYERVLKPRATKPKRSR